jgi:hypothetical protein
VYHFFHFPRKNAKIKAILILINSLAETRRLYPGLVYLRLRRYANCKRRLPSCDTCEENLKEVNEFFEATLRNLSDQDWDSYMTMRQGENDIFPLFVHHPINSNDPKFPAKSSSSSMQAPSIKRKPTEESLQHHDPKRHRNDSKVSRKFQNSRLLNVLLTECKGIEQQIPLSLPLETHLAILSHLPLDIHIIKSSLSLQFQLGLEPSPFLRLFLSHQY